MRARSGCHSGHSFTVTAYEAERFWARVEKTDGCWRWTSTTSRGRRGNYGRMRLADSGITTAAHRVAYTIANGPIPEGMIVCHRCDNPVCVRPEHLFLGTQRDNVRDMIAKKRDRNRSAA